MQKAAAGHRHPLRQVPRGWHLAKASSPSASHVALGEVSVRLNRTPAPRALFAECRRSGTRRRLVSRPHPPSSPSAADLALGEAAFHLKKGKHNTPALTRPAPHTHATHAPSPARPPRMRPAPLPAGGRAPPPAPRTPPAAARLPAPRAPRPAARRAPPRPPRPAPHPSPASAPRHRGPIPRPSPARCSQRRQRGQQR